MENELEHFGVKGMKWGVRRSESKTSNPKSQARAEKREKRKARSERIREARSRVPDGETRILRAKTQYDRSLGSKGEKAARKAYQKAKNKHLDDLEVSEMLTFGEQVATAIVVGAVGALAVGSIVAGEIRYHNGWR